MAEQRKEQYRQELKLYQKKLNDLQGFVDNPIELNESNETDRYIIFLKKKIQQTQSQIDYEQHKINIFTENLNQKPNIIVKKYQHVFLKPRLVLCRIVDSFAIKFKRVKNIIK
jgi:hypothetical protein